MLFRIRPLRERGRRLPWREVVNGPVYRGELLTYELQAGSQRVRVAALNGLEPAVAKTLPELFEPVLVGVAPLALVLRGYERIESDRGAYTVVQEWHCELPDHDSRSD